MTRMRSPILRAGMAASALLFCLAQGCHRSQAPSGGPEYAPTTRQLAPERREVAPVPVRRQENPRRLGRESRAGTVYVTESGKKYHRLGCTYLKKSRQSISRSDAQRSGYTACSVCQP